MWSARSDDKRGQRPRAPSASASASCSPVYSNAAGGPLIHTANGPLFYLIGFPVSGYSGCGSPAFPGVYLKVAAVSPWILNVTTTSVNTAAILWKGRTSVQQVDMRLVQSFGVPPPSNTSLPLQSVVFQIDPNVNVGTTVLTKEGALCLGDHERCSVAPPRLVAS